MAGWRESGLVVLGVVLHSAYLLSVFDIYFKTPIVHGMDPVPPRIQAPAKRLVLFIADGLRADKFFEVEADSGARAPYLHSVIHNEGRWGVSHARPPTESRPGHVAIIGGFYEDPSAVTKGWKANPVEFDSIFNRSRHTVSFGSPDIVPIFCGGLNNTLWESYSHEFEDFATDASFLDNWAFDKFRELIDKAAADLELRQSLHGDGLVVFLHLLGCDTNGHAHRPYSQVYLNNIRVVDNGVENTVKLMEEMFPDGKTAYIFTADHGMSNKGSHGDGDPANTETPIVAWGSGIRGPGPATPEGDYDDGRRFVDDHGHSMQTPSEWGLETVERIDVNQGDIAPLMATLLGLPCPLNSVGTLPTEYLALDKREQAEAIFANAKQILNQVLRKAQLKEATSLYFKPFTPLAGYSKILDHIDALISGGHYDSALQSGQELISLTLDGLHYFQTYDWLFLMTTVVVGYVGWMVYILLHVLNAYSSFTFFQRKWSRKDFTSNIGSWHIRIAGGLFMGACSVVLLLEQAPILYHLYLGLAIFFWTEILCNKGNLEAIFRALVSAKFSWVMKLLFAITLTFLILELLVVSFFRREVYTVVFLGAGVVGAAVVSRNTSRISMIPAVVLASCWALSGFTLMPVEISDNTLLVVGSGLAVIMLAVMGRWLDCLPPYEQLWWPILSVPSTRIDKTRLLFGIQVMLVAGTSMMVWITTVHRSKMRTLPYVYQIMNWSISGVSVLLPLKSASTILTRLTSIYLGFAPPFLLLSIGYEALFYSALAMVLLSWILVESAALCAPVPDYQSRGSTVRFSHSDMDSLQGLPMESGYYKQQYKVLKLADTRIALCFLVLINVAFFGTGNVASVASFEISSVYRFVTIFNPYTMGGLLLCKLFIPFILVTSAFSAVTTLLNLPRLGCYFIVLLMSDVMTIHFFFLVRVLSTFISIALRGQPQQTSCASASTINLSCSGDVIGICS